MTPDPAELYRRLRAETVQQLHLDADNLTPQQALTADLIVVLRLEVDGVQAAALAGRTVDVGKLADLTKLLKSLTPPDKTPGFDPFEELDARCARDADKFMQILRSGADAIEARKVHLSEVYAKEIVELKATISKLNDQLADAKYLDQRPTIPAEPQQPPLPAPNPSPPAHYLQSSDSFLSSIPGGRDRNV